MHLQELPKHNRNGLLQVYALVKHRGQVVTVSKYRKRNEWDEEERNVIEGLAEYDLPDMFRLLNGYEKNEFSWILSRKGAIIARRRFDHIFASKKLNPMACHYLHYFRENQLSDHSAI